MSDAGSGDSAGGLSSFFFYVFFVQPVTSWFLKPGRFPKKRGLYYAIGFLIALAAVKTGLELSERPPSHYEVLGVTRASSPLEIKRAYKSRSLELHPDKNPSPTAQEEFNELKNAYDVLMDLELREIYNKFGEDGIKMNKKIDEYSILVEIAVYYITWGILSYVLTLGKASSSARNWIFTGQIIMLIIEVSLVLQQGSLPAWFLPQKTEHDIVWLLHNLYPAYMNGCRSICSFLYVNVEEQTRQLLLALSSQNQDILTVLRDIQVHIHSLAAGGAATAKGAGVPNVNAAALKATTTGKLKELEQRMKLSREAAAIPSSASSLAANLKENKKDGIMNSVWIMVLLYFAFYYFFG